MELNEPSAKYLVQAGYKRTDIGRIPIDWRIERLGAVSDCYIGLTYSPRDVRSFGTLVLRSSNVQRGRLAFEDCVFVDMELPPRVITRQNDILVCVRNGSRSLIGKCAIVDSTTEGSAFGAFMAVLRGEASHFLFHIFQSELIKEQIRERMGATINQITNRDMAEFEIVWPYDERERTRIGMALTDADALIESLEQLLTKKRQIKQGAMQDLLTGQRRLPGFSRASEHHQTELGFIPSDWDVIPIAQIAQCLIGLTYSPNDVRSAGTMVLRSSNVQDGFLAFDDNVYVDMDLPPRVITQEGDILICVRNGSRQLIGKCALIDANTAGSAFGAFMAVLRSTSSAFLFQQFQSAILKKQIGEVMGATINQITNKDMAAFKVIWPKTEDERTAIATVLSDMDTEITAFEAQLSKARHLKQGMAQALLTGRIRLV